jgi:hypothetical protein
MRRESGRHLTPDAAPPAKGNRRRTHQTHAICVDLAASRRRPLLLTQLSYALTETQPGTHSLARAALPATVVLPVPLRMRAGSDRTIVVSWSMVPIAMILSGDNRRDGAEHRGKGRERCRIISMTIAGRGRLQTESGQCNRSRSSSRDRAARQRTHVRPRLVVPPHRRVVVESTRGLRRNQADSALYFCKVA